VPSTSAGACKRLKWDCFTAWIFRYHGWATLGAVFNTYAAAFAPAPRIKDVAHIAPLSPGAAACARLRGSGTFRRDSTRNNRLSPRSPRTPAPPDRFGGERICTNSQIRAEWL